MEIVMPKVGLTMTEGTIVEWHKREGEFVKRGELLFSFETEKSTLEYESPAEGVLQKIMVAAGQLTPCHTPIAVVGDAKEITQKVPSIDKAVAAAQPPATSHQPPTTNARQPISPRAKTKARELGVNLSDVAASADGVIRERDVLAFSPAPKPKINITPVAQRIATELGIDPAQLQGSGRDGQITREDVELESKRQKAEGKTAQVEIEAQMLSPARRVTAQRMSDNAQAAPHVTLHTEADATQLMSAREQLSAELNTKISYNALLVAICAKALKEHRDLNASWVAPSSVIHHAFVHIGVAVDTPKGLYVPVLKDAGAKSIPKINSELSDLIARTLDGKAKLDELKGGTFTITNLGVFEVDAFTPIINLPEAAILGVGRMMKKAVVEREDRIVPKLMLPLSLSFDHRVVDGAPAAKFLQRIKQLIERPMALLLG